MVERAPRAEVRSPLIRVASSQPPRSRGLSRTLEELRTRCLPKCGRALAAGAIAVRLRGAGGEH